MRAMKNVVGMALALSMLAAVGFAGPSEPVDYADAGLAPFFLSETHDERVWVEEGTATIREHEVTQGRGRVVDTYHVRATFSGLGEGEKEYTGSYDLTEITVFGSRGAYVYTRNERVTLTCQDGITDRSHTVERITVNANGEVVVNFVKEK